MSKYSQPQEREWKMKPEPQPELNVKPQPEYPQCPQGVVAALIFYYQADQRSVAEGILESADKRPAARALRAIGVLP